MDSNERKILWMCGVGHFYSHFYMLLFPSLALFIRDDFGLSLADTLNLGFPMYLLFGLVAFPMGILADRYWGHRPLLLAMLVGMGVSSLICAVSRGSAGLVAGLSGIGFFAAIYHPVGIGLISKCCRSRGAALGNNGVWGNLGIGLAPLCAGGSAYLVSWRAGFALFGCVALLCGLGMLAMRVDETPVAARVGGAARSGQGGNVLYFVLMLCCMALLGLCYRGTVVSVPGYFETRITGLSGLFEWDPGIALSASHSFGTTILVSGIYLFGIFGQLTGGRLADRLDLRVAYLLFHAISLPFMLLMAVWTEWPLFCAGMGYLFFSLGMQPIENSLVARLTPNHLRSVAYGLKFVLVLGMGSFAVKLVKWIITEHEPRMVYQVQSGFIVMVVLLILSICWLSRGKSFRND